jgi:hypothetical protein
VKTRGQRQSINIVDRRVPRDLNQSIANQGTSAPVDRTVIGPEKMRKDRLRAVMSTSAPVLSLYNNRRRVKQ